MGQAQRLDMGWLVAALSALSVFSALPVPVAAQGARPAIYSCVDGQGRRWTADRPIAACADREQRVLGPSGTERQRLAPRLSDAEAAARERQLRTQQQQAQRTQDERRRERALLMRYPRQSAHDAERSHALEPVDEGIAGARQRIEQGHSGRHRLAQEMEFYQRDPSKAPPALRRAVADSERELAEQQRYLDGQLRERQRIQRRFDDELAVLRRLWRAAQADLADAVPEAETARLP